MDKTPLDCIVFAIRQAQEAEAFGFTRNECNRNLKLAIDHYWQNKTVGRHLLNKANLPRSKAAVGLSNGETIVEHSVPKGLIVNWLMEMDEPTNAEVKRILANYYSVLLVSKEEDKRLNQAGLRSKMPANWDGENAWARYEAVGIERADTEEPVSVIPMNKPVPKATKSELWDTVKSETMSEAVKKTWEDEEVAKKRKRRDAVIVDGKYFSSTGRAFVELGLPMKKCIPFRLRLKKARTLNEFGYEWKVVALNYIPGRGVA